MAMHGRGSPSSLWTGEPAILKLLTTSLVHKTAIPTGGQIPANVSFPPASAGEQDASVPTQRAPLESMGFRHFIKEPSPAQRFTLDRLPFEPQRSWQRAEHLMGKLTELCMVQPSAPVRSRDNTSIPSGYTYFLQLIAHDLVNSSSLLSRNGGRLFGFANLRDSPLRLETIYGGGPAQCPHAYQMDESRRHRLRLGAMRRDLSGGQWELLRDRARDLARGIPGTATDSVGNSFSEPHVADPRNDSHALISQMVVLFHMLHNRIVDSLRDGGAITPLQDRFADTGRLFNAASIACVLIYRAIIRADLLPKLLHKGVHRAYETASVPVRDKAETEWRAPFELTHGFLRFAHGMVRASYSFNRLTPFSSGPDIDDGAPHRIDRVLAHTSEASPAAMPFVRNWVVEWDRFFGPTAQNFSLLIDPWANFAFESAIKEGDSSKALIERDLLSSIAVQPWSIAGLVQELQPTHGELLAGSEIFLNNEQRGHPTNEPPWFEPVKAWLLERANRFGNPPQLTELEDLSRDPPIPFFVRFEAGRLENGNGQHLGVLGSIVVADVIYGILDRDPILGIGSRSDIRDQLAQLSSVVFGDSAREHQKVFAFLGNLNSFPALIQFLGPQLGFPPTD